MKNVLYLEKRGCDFWNDEPARSISDVGNYRVCTHGEVVPGKDGNVYHLEFRFWRDRKKARYTHKTTGRPLKHIKYDIINPCGVAIDTQHTNDRGSWRNCKLEADISEKNYSYTKADILTIVNEISTATYTEIIFAPHRAMQAVPAIKKIAGYRENNILDNLTEITVVQADRHYTVYRFHGNDGDYFDYEINQNKITG
jgi:hypothetical protein